MPHCIALFFEPLLRWLFPAPGRHRRTNVLLETGRRDVATLTLPCVTPAVALVRPYMWAADERWARRPVGMVR
jgi:hypothetical protein